ncbi:MAG TPA: bifunctional glutamate N-acetyltransferase/amino-acid acetyltransferase ArgJ [Candidatus Binataceae bacterium]|nr:bifunctional glutamate N-acetyltransferase/amino-acid acetyltransferase ArgJ [Candidatus Binataceae bacterium]
MNVELAPTAVPGFRFAGVSAGFKTTLGAPDLGLIVADRPATAAAAFTANSVKAAPVLISAERIKTGRLQVIAANSGCANSFTGAAGMKLARESCAHLAKLIGCESALVAPCSTGVIGHLYSLEKFQAGAEAAVRELREDRMGDFARAIMTTDTRPKVAHTTLSAGGAKITIAGAAKGVGMISPKMATMFAFLITDAAIAPATLRRSLKAALPRTFNAITVDGDMSTNDTVIFMAGGAAKNRSLSAREQTAFDHAAEEIAATLARELVADGEGATKLVTIDVRGARTAIDAERVARQVANSPLVKTAFFGHDPNVGRILMAAGASGAHVVPERLTLWIGGVKVAGRGALIADALPEAASRMREREFTVRLDLGVGKASSSILTCDLSYEYVRINAEYTT